MASMQQTCPFFSEHRYHAEVLLGSRLFAVMCSERCNGIGLLRSLASGSGIRIGHTESRFTGQAKEHFGKLTLCRVFFQSPTRSNDMKVM